MIGPAVYESGASYSQSVTALPNGNAFIAYRNISNLFYGTFTIYSPAGVEVLAPTIFESAASAEMSTTTDANGNGFIACQDEGNSDFGTFAICGEAELVLEVVDGNEVHLNNKTDETLELFLSL